MKESTLLKLLEYNKTPNKQLYIDICLLIGLEIYIEEDPLCYTISSSFFVLDIVNDECTLIFVEEELNTKLGYIQLYLNHFFHNKFLFYCLLKYLSTSNKNLTLNNKESCSKYKSFCNCILKSEYCHTFDIAKIPENFNIFTHSKFDFPLDIYFNNRSLTDPKIEAPENFSNIFTAKFFSKFVYQFFIKKPLFFYEFENIKVIEKSVFIDEKRCQIASLAFLKGSSLKKALELSKLFKS